MTIRLSLSCAPLPNLGGAIGVGEQHCRSSINLNLFPPPDRCDEFWGKPQWFLSEVYTSIGMERVPE